MVPGSSELSAAASVAGVSTGSARSIDVSSAAARRTLAISGVPSACPSVSAPKSAEAANTAVGTTSALR